MRKYLPKRAFNTFQIVFCFVDEIQGEVHFCFQLIGPRNTPLEQLNFERLLYVVIVAINTIFLKQFVCVFSCSRGISFQLRFFSRISLKVWQMVTYNNQIKPWQIAISQATAFVDETLCMIWSKKWIEWILLLLPESLFSDSFSN